jgi:hypothetical protein
MTSRRMPERWSGLDSLEPWAYGSDVGGEKRPEGILDKKGVERLGW